MEVAVLILLVVLVLLLAFFEPNHRDYRNKHGDRIRVYKNGTIENMDMGKVVRRYLDKNKESIDKINKSVDENKN